MVQGRKEVHVFQRKTATDLFSTLMHRQNKEALWDTLKALCEYRRKHNFKVYLIIEGDIRKEIKIHKYPVTLWKNVKRVILMSYYVPIEFTQNMQETWESLRNLDKALTQPREYIPPPPVTKKGRSLQRCQEDVICSAVDKLGRKKAQNLLRYFGSVEAVVKADVGDLVRVNGIGTKTAKALYDVLHLPYGGEQTNDRT